MTANLHRFAALDALSRAAAGQVVHLSAQAIAARGRFTVALSGGSLPKVLCPPLTAEPFRSQVDWSNWHIFWADERCVPLTGPDSNYYLAQKYLFDHVDIPATQIHPLDDSLDPTTAAAAYQARLAQVFQPESGTLPRFDLILLGMGEDGHTASLFPGHPLLNETKKWVAPVFDSPKPPPERITLTLPVINNSRQIMFLATGSGKVDTLAQIMNTTAPLPAGMVQPTNGKLHWFVDEAAAAGLKT
jgi:6-phosphogluconolactonase